MTCDRGQEAYVEDVLDLFRGQVRSVEVSLLTCQRAEQYLQAHDPCNDVIKYCQTVLTTQVIPASQHTSGDEMR